MSDPDDHLRYRRSDVMLSICSNGSAWPGTWGSASWRDRVSEAGSRRALPELERVAREDRVSAFEYLADAARPAAHSSLIG